MRENPVWRRSLCGHTARTRVLILTTFDHDEWKRDPADRTVSRYVKRRINMRESEILISAVSDEGRCRRTGFPVCGWIGEHRQYPRRPGGSRSLAGLAWGRIQMLELAVEGHVTSHGSGEAGQGQDEDGGQEPAQYGGGVEPPLHEGAVGGVGIGVPCRSLIE